MPESLQISNLCLAHLAKKNKKVDVKTKLDDFLQPWPDLYEFADEIFAYIQ